MYILTSIQISGIKLLGKLGTKHTEIYNEENLDQGAWFVYLWTWEEQKEKCANLCSFKPIYILSSHHAAFFALAYAKNTTPEMQLPLCFKLYIFA